VATAEGWKNPALFLRGEADIEQTKIGIKITGSREAPEVDLSSQSSLPLERLMIMLVTGKAWQGADEALASRALSPELAKDFVDYFLLNGAGQKIAEHFGLSSISVQVGEDSRGVAVRKELSPQLEVGYEVEQKPVEVGKSAEVSHKIGGEFQVTDSVTVGVEKEIKNPSQAQETPDDPAAPAKDKIYFKYKTKF
jgi:autotransporter translocation and assembly factor TamB